MRALAFYTPVSDQSWMKAAPGRGCDLMQGVSIRQLGASFSPEEGLQVSVPFGFLVYVMNVQNSLVRW